MRGVLAGVLLLAALMLAYMEFVIATFLEPLLRVLHPLRG